jgi:hypothetical protein
LNIVPLPATTAEDVTFAKMNLVAPAGAGLIVNVCAFEVPPPGAGLKTVICAVPVAATSDPRIVAVTSVEETTVVDRDEPFHSTTELPIKFVPVTVSVKFALPANVDIGEMEIVVGTGFAAAVIVNVCAFEVPPPGAAFTTVTNAVPVALTSAARIVAVTSVEETNVVVRDEPFQSTTESFTKFVPLTVRVKLELPAAVDVGLSDVVVGAGFRMVNVSLFEVPPPGAGVITVTAAVPAVATSELRMVAVSVVLETNIVARGLPFQSTVDDEINPVPVSVSVKPGFPAIVEVGEIAERVGAGLAELKIVKVAELELAWWFASPG